MSEREQDFTKMMDMIEKEGDAMFGALEARLKASDLPPEKIAKLSTSSLILRVVTLGQDLAELRTQMAHGDLKDVKTEDAAMFARFEAIVKEESRQFIASATALDKRIPIP